VPWRQCGNSAAPAPAAPARHQSLNRLDAAFSRIAAGGWCAARHNRARNSVPDHPLWRRRFLEQSDEPDDAFTDEDSGLDPPSAA